MDLEGLYWQPKVWVAKVQNAMLGEISVTFGHMRGPDGVILGRCYSLGDLRVSA